MKADFWHRKWARDEIGFHQPGVNALLKTYWPMLGVAQGAAVLVPLCGKSQDMVWLHATGHPVLGVELSEKALADFLTENDLNGRPAQHDRFCGYELEDMTLFCGDFSICPPMTVKGFKPSMTGRRWWPCRRKCAVGMPNT